MTVTSISYIFFFYGLAFFSMGLAVMLEFSKCSDTRLRHALRPLAVFGFLHAIHEWLEMFELLQILPGFYSAFYIWAAIRLGILAFSFLSLAAFGSSLLAATETSRRYSLLVPTTLAAIWAFGLMFMRSHYNMFDLVNVSDVWTRYTLAVPGAVFACAGLVNQQRIFRMGGMAQFGRDSLWAAVAFIWYGVIGQTFTRYSPLPPSNFINQDLFLQVFGFPVQLLRAIMAILAAFFVMRFLRSFEVEIDAQIRGLQRARVEEAERREALRGDLLRRVVAAQEAERQRVARELHDETGQALTAIGLGLRGVSTAINQDTDKAASNLRQLESLVTHSLTELQRLISDLRPSHLDDLGLSAALRWYINEVKSRTKLEIRFEEVGAPRTLPSETRTALFRVVQEALTNVVKHAQARHAVVNLIFRQEDVIVQIEDDGRGFNPLTLAQAERSSWGLEGMRERATLLGGKAEIWSNPGYGTRVQVTIPYAVPVEAIDENALITRG